MPENLYPHLPTAPSMSQESFNIEMVRKYYQKTFRIIRKDIMEVLGCFQKLQTLYLQLMTFVRNIDRKMKVQTEENFQKTIIDKIVNLKKALEQK